MPPPIRRKWGLRGCDSDQSMVKVSLPTGLLSLTVGAYLRPVHGKGEPADQDNQVSSTSDTVDDRWIKSTII